MVHPRLNPVDSTITLAIEHQQQPLLLLEVKPPSDFHLDSGREGATEGRLRHGEQGWSACKGCRQSELLGVCGPELSEPRYYI